MKPFDLEAAKRGEPIVTRDGRKAKFVAYVPEAKNPSVIALISGEVTIFGGKGNFDADFEATQHDLFMSPPPMRSINGYEYPEPVREPLELGQCYWVPFPAEDELTYVEGFKWSGGRVDMTWLKRGLIHLTPEAAVAHARAIILAGGGEV